MVTGHFFRAQVPPSKLASPLMIKTAAGVVTGGAIFSSNSLSVKGQLLGWGGGWCILVSGRPCLAAWHRAAKGICSRSWVVVGETFVLCSWFVRSLQLVRSLFISCSLNEKKGVSKTEGFMVKEAGAAGLTPLGKGRLEN